MVKGNPIKFLDAIEEHSMSYLENRYEVSVVLDGLRNLINLKQKDDEVLAYYTCRFNMARDIMILHMGEFQIPKLAKADKD